ncbi:CocE/NonD family hydrolase [Nocardia sp. NBC_01730]|uniref:CocE/NonD family hydrolase n=1 Tax=Nocardia sp. NBC_01730 TaxID=2975998 RepID=UPI002E13E9CB|nr:CocE/NonD family hydrolase [Nocardia sp. NBC_01730]
MFDIRIERDLSIPMADGTLLLADLYLPANSPAQATILVRSPMGRRPMGILYGCYFARHGFQVVVQDGRSCDEVLPLSTEREDGLATVAWLRAQPWFHGPLALHGMSAMGFAHWAITADVTELRAMSVHVAASSIADTIFTGGSTALESVLIWCSNHSFTTALLAPRRARRAIASGRPAAELDVATGGRTVPFYQAVIADEGPGSPLRAGLDHSHVPRSGVAASVHLVGGWYDIFLPGLIRDFLALRAAGGTPHLTVGPWGHYHPQLFLTANREARQWFRAHLCGDRTGLRELPIRLFVTGARQWRDYANWPPPGTRPVPWFLHTAGRLARNGPDESGRDCYRYDPADATPAPRGPVIVGHSRPEDCRRIETRSDLLTYTSEPLSEPVEVIGTATARLYFHSSPPTGADFVVRLCDVHPNGRSYNICEGVRRVGLETTGRIEVELWPTAHQFAAGHRLRVHVCGAAVPRFARHREVVEQEIFHDPRRPSAVVLPIVTTMS